MAIIEATGLTKTYRVAQKTEGVLGALRGLYHREYREVTAVNQISFSIEPGEMVAFLGPNGAGKTTTLKMLVRPDLPHPGRGPSPGLHPLATGRPLPTPILAGDGPEEPALVGPAGRRQLPVASRDLFDTPGRLRADARRIDRTARGSEADSPGGARAVARRANEDGADRRALARAPAALARRTDDRPGRRGSGSHPEMPA